MGFPGIGLPVSAVFVVVAARDADWFCYDAGRPGTPTPFAPVPEGFELRHVQHVQRHGLRTPLCSRPANTPPWYCDAPMLEAVSVAGPAPAEGLRRVYRQQWMGYPTENTLPGNCTTGYLTAKGVGQVGAIGAGLRASLAGFLDTYSEADVYVRSSDVDRTKQSAFALLDAVFPPGDPPPGRQVPVIPVHTADVDFDHTTGDDFDPDRCPGIQPLIDEISAGKPWQDVLQALAPLAETFDSVYGGHWGTLRAFVGRVPDHLMMMECHGMQDQIPDTLGPAYRAELYRQYDLWWSVLEMERRPALIQMGRFLGNLAQNMDRAVGSPGSEYKLRVYMAHELTIGSLMVILGAPIGACVPWAAHLQLQLLANSSGAMLHDPDSTQQMHEHHAAQFPHRGKEETASMFVRILFDGRPVAIPGCSSPGLTDDICPFTTFRKMVSTVVLNASALLQTYCNQSLVEPIIPAC
eukprot:gene7076-169_t